MNEPWVGDHMADPTLLVPGKADHRTMEPLWNKGTDVIRTVDNTTLIFFEGSTYDILSGFNNVPGGDGSKTVHSYHYYKPPQLGNIEYTLKNRKTDSDRLRTAGMMTEFQFWDSGPDSIKEIFETARQADRYMQSWQGWAYNNVWSGSGADAVARPAIVRAYSRTYVEATAGTTQTMYFQDSTTKYWVSWKADKSIQAPTLIRFAPKINYPDGIRVFINPPGSGTYTVDNATNTVRISHTSATVNGETIMASVQPFYPTDIIQNPESGKCLDNGNAYVTPNNPIILWDCSSDPNQIWKFKDNTIQLAFDPDHNSDKYCMDTQPIPSNTKYLNIVLNPCDAGKASQKWSVTPTGNIVNTATGYCVDINGSNYKSGTGLLAYPCAAGGTQKNQVWKLPRGASGSKYHMDPFTNLSIEVQEMIISNLPKRTCFVCMQVCRSWTTVFARPIWRSIEALDQPTFSAAQRFYRLKQSIEADNGVAIQKYGHLIRTLDTCYLSMVDLIVKNDPERTCAHLKKMVVHSKADPRVPPAFRANETATKKPGLNVQKSAIAALLRYNHDLRTLSLHCEAAHPDMGEDGKPVEPNWMGALPESLESLVVNTPCFGSYQPPISSACSPSAPHPLPRSLIHLQKLIMQGPYINGSVRLDLLRRCPNLEVLRLYIREDPLDPCSVISEVLASHCPQLTAIRVDGQTHDKSLSLLLGSSATGWKSFMFNGSSDSFGPLSAKALLKHTETLENVRLESCPAFTSTNIQQLLCSAPRLRRFQGISINRLLENDLSLRADELVLSKWVCTNLESFACRITGVPRPDLTRRTNGRLLTSTMHTTGTIEESYQLQRRVYEQLGRLKKLRHLVLGGDFCLYGEENFNIAMRERANEGVYFSPMNWQTGYQYECLSMTLESGLGLLSGLKDMRAVVVEGMAVGLSNPAEKIWQRKHWPLLRTGKLFANGYFSDPFWSLFLE
ncbi:hypothetical protein BG015_000125 [Linnemannia schmuckeri]|uniref:F-box domain-containing protein n=1 Tax=Linnemannia schmuckeri TaxID=64567 RepID=A0A9P5RV19_9FUNG|nr:hypothetical protein BG015_000125 [Linnemannia schmuckeri]